MARRNPSQRRRERLAWMQEQGIEMRAFTQDIPCVLCGGGKRAAIDPGVKVKGKWRKQCGACLGNGTMKISGQVATRVEMCPECHGSGIGKHEDRYHDSCTNCGGEGEVVTQAGEAT